MKSKQCAAIEALMRKAKPFRTHADLQQELKKKRKQNAKEYKPPKVVELVLRPQKISLAQTTCYKLGSGKTCIVYFHGGSYVDPPLVFHWRFLQHLVAEADVTVVLPIYGRAPQCHCYSTVMSQKRVFLQLVLEYGAENLVVMGDSAGGGLALAVCEYLANKGLPLPRKCVLLSPWVDVDMNNDYTSQLDSDVALNLEELKFFGEVYRDKLPKGHYFACPLYGLTNNLPETHVFAGGAELFLPDCQKLKQLAEEKGVNLQLYVYPEMQHVFLTYPIPEAKEARKLVVEILQEGRATAEEKAMPQEESADGSKRTRSDKKQRKRPKEVT